MHFYLLSIGAVLSISASNQPQAVPIPEQKPSTAQQEEAPVPQVKDVPIPTPEPGKETQPEAKPDTSPKPAAPKPENDKKVEDSASGSSDSPKCELELRNSGAEFEPVKPIRDGGDCGIGNPVELRAINAKIKLDAPAQLSCQAALALTQWVQQSVVPAIKLATPDKELASLSNASSYVCRNRNHTKGGKISEHAKGNAYDIASLTFSDKSKLIMQPRAEDGTLEGALQRTITTSACLFFRTVLSPGSDATHQNHLHLDVMQRKNDYRYCR